MSKPLPAGPARWLRRALPALFATLLAAGAAAQECAPLEVSAPPERPRPCRLMERLLTCPRQRGWEDATRTFTAAVELTSVDATPQEEAEWAYGVTGCAGAVVAPTLDVKNVYRMEMELTSPSGATLLRREESVSEDGQVRFAAVELPQSGRYSVQLRTWARPQTFTGCDHIRRLRCTAQSDHTGYPRRVVVAWRGTAGLAAMALGDEWHPALEAQVPVTRRVRLDPGVAASVRVETLAGAPVRVRVGRARGGVLAERSFPTGHGAVPVPADESQQELLVRLALDGGGDGTVGVTVAVDSANRPSAVRTPRLPAVQHVLAAGVARSGRIAKDATERWEFSARAGEQYALELVPSGVARLALHVAVYSLQTEEVLTTRDEVTTRAIIPLLTPATGRYVVELRGTDIQVPDADGRALYTITLRR